MSLSFCSVSSKFFNVVSRLDNERESLLAHVATEPNTPIRAMMPACCGCSYNTCLYSIYKESEGVLPSSVLIALHYIGGAGLRAAFIGRFADTDRFAIPEVDVYLDILDSSLSLQATISFQIAVKRGGRITCRLACLLDHSYKLRETVRIGFSLVNKGISPMNKTASRTSLWRF